LLENQWKPWKVENSIQGEFTGKGVWWTDINRVEMGFFGEIITNEKVEIPIPDGYILKVMTIVAAISLSFHS
jgi:hypothetical protein